MNIEIKELITEAIDQGKHLIAPRMVYAIHPVISISSDGSLHLRNGLLLSVPHDEIDPHVKQLVAVICTIGSALEKTYRRRNAKDELLQAVILDATGVALLESLSDKAYTVIRELARTNRLFAGCRFGPGIRGMALTSQSILFNLVEGVKIGVHLNQKMVMIPNKSVSFFLGLTSDKKGASDVYKCRSCPKKDCQFRMNPEPNKDGDVSEKSCLIL